MSRLHKILAIARSCNVARRSWERLCTRLSLASELSMMSSCGQNLPVIQADVSRFISPDGMKQRVIMCLFVNICNVPDLCRGLISPHRLLSLTSIQTHCLHPVLTEAVVPNSLYLVLFQGEKSVLKFY